MRIYLAQPAIDQALASGQIQLDGDLVRLVAGGRPMQLSIVAAVYFAQLDEGGDDPEGLVGCVRSGAQLQQMGAEHYDRSVLVGERAYSVVPGFVGTPVGPDGTPLIIDAAAWRALSEFLAALG
jgi:hypothetical protein